MNLYGVLRRLQQEANRAGSALNKSDWAYLEELRSLCMDCRLNLDDVNSFLLAHKTVKNYEVRILGTLESTNRERAIIEHFSSEIQNQADLFSGLLVVATTDSLSGLDEQLNDSTGRAISTMLNDLTSLLIANGDIRSTMLVRSSNEEFFWGKIQEQLLSKGLEKAFINQNRKAMLRYIRALERKSAFGSSEISCQDDIRDKLVKVESEGCKASNTHGGTKRKSDSGVEVKDRKRARSNLGQSQRSHNSSKANAKRSATNDEADRFFRFRNPRTVFGPEVDNDFLADFLEEEESSSQQNGLRHQIRDIYRTISEDFEPRYELCVFQKSHQMGVNEKEHRALSNEIEKNVVFKLDQLQLGSHDDLRSLRKMIVLKAQQMLDDLDKLKD